MTLHYKMVAQKKNKFARLKGPLYNITLSSKFLASLPVFGVGSMAGIRFWRFKRHLVDIQDKMEIGRKRRSFTNISLKCLTDSLSLQTITIKS